MPALTGCLSSGTGTFTVDGTRHRATSVRCTATGPLHVIELKAGKASLEFVVRDHIPPQLHRLTSPGGPTGTLGMDEARGIGRGTVEQRGMRWIVKVDAVPLTDGGEVGSASDVVAISADAYCAKIY